MLRNKQSNDQLYILFFTIQYNTEGLLPCHDNCTEIKRTRATKNEDTNYKLHNQTAAAT